MDRKQAAILMGICNELLECWEDVEAKEEDSKSVLQAKTDLFNEFDVPTTISLTDAEQWERNS